MFMRINHRIFVDRNDNPFPATPQRKLIQASTVAMMASAQLLLPTYASAADDAQFAQVQQENAALKQEIEALKQRLSQQQPNTEPKDTAATNAQRTQASTETSAHEKTPIAKPEQQPYSLDTVVVRARAKLERLQDVPLSISVLSGKELERENSLTIGDITKRSASVQYNTDNARQGSVSIRGVGKQGQVDQQDPGVGVIVDGVSYAWGPLSHQDFIDVDSVEVLRGPQGTLLGKNTAMGVLQVNTKKPSFTPEASYESTFGNYGNKEQSFLGKAILGGAVIDDLLAWRGSFYVDRRRGPYGNIWNQGDQSYPDSNRIAGRVQFLLTPSENFSARLSYDSLPRYPQNDNGLTYYKPLPTSFSNGTPIITSTSGGSSSLTIAQSALDRDYFTKRAGYNWNGYNGSLVGSLNTDQQQPLYNGQQGYSGELNWVLPKHTLTSITSYRTNYFDARNDEGSPFDIIKNNNTDTQYTQSSQEFRLTSQSGGLLDYQVGSYFLKVKNFVNQKVEWGSDAGAYFANNAQYGRLIADAPGQLLLTNSLNHTYVRQHSLVDNNSAAIFGQVNWNLNDKTKLTTGLRWTFEQRKFTSQRGVDNVGLGANLDKFTTNATGSSITTGSTAAADAIALQYFGQAGGYAALTSAQKQQVADASKIRSKQIGTTFGTTAADEIRSGHPNWVISPSYKFNDDITGYFSGSYGEKAGVAQVLSNGAAVAARKERDQAFELGLKTALLNKSLILNTAIYQQNIKDFQQAGRVLDPVATSLAGGVNTYASGTVNAEKVQLRGVELDANYNGINNISLRFSGAYNKATYKRFDYSGLAAEENYAGAPSYKSLAGRQLSGAPKFYFNVGGEYRKGFSWLKGYEFRSSFTTYYVGKQNLDAALSSYAWQKAYTLTDVAVGLYHPRETFNVALRVKNLFDKEYYTANTWSSYTPGTPRFYSLSFSGKF